MVSQKTMDTIVGLITDACESNDGDDESLPFKMDDSIIKSLRYVEEEKPAEIVDDGVRLPTLDIFKSEQTITQPAPRPRSTVRPVMAGIPMSAGSQHTIVRTMTPFRPYGANETETKSKTTIVTPGIYGWAATIALLLSVVLMGISGYVYSAYRAGLQLESYVRLSALGLSGVVLVTSMTGAVLIVRRLLKSSYDRKHSISKIYDMKGHLRVLIELLAGLVFALVSIMLILHGM